MNTISLSIRQIFSDDCFAEKENKSLTRIQESKTAIPIFISVNSAKNLVLDKGEVATALYQRKIGIFHLMCERDFLQSYLNDLN